MAHEAKEPTKSEKLYPVKLTHRYFTGNSYIDEVSGNLVEERIEAGNTIEVTMEIAMRLLEAKKAERADPLL